MKRRIPSLLLALLGSTPVFGQVDLLIENARVVDGTGSPWFVADVAIEEGYISAIGNVDASSAERVLDARGRVLAPGFIDVHTHVEAGATRGGIEGRPVADNFLFDGVTTIVTGNCGGSRRTSASGSRSSTDSASASTSRASSDTTPSAVP